MSSEPDLIARIKDALRGPEGDGYTDAGMEDAFFRWPVIERAILALEASDADTVRVPREAGAAMLGLVAYVTGLPESLRWSAEFKRYVNGRFNEIAAMLTASHPKPASEDRP